MSFDRKVRRAKAKKLKKEAQKEMATKVALFDKLSSNCLTCEKSFDKMNKQQVMSWSVVVRQEEEKVNLYCPECWEGAKKIIKDFKDRIKNRGDGSNK